MNLYGASGHAKVVIDILKKTGNTIDLIIDDNRDIKKILGINVVQNKNINLAKCEFIITVGKNETRKKITQNFNANYGIAIHPNTTIDPTVTIEKGTVIMAGTIINSSTIIGKHCIINTSSSIDHDCILNDFVHISPNATICGGITIGEGTHVGAGATIIPNLSIGKWCTIGAGAVVIKDILDGVTVVGNPGRVV
jgi:acetyltransferase EpsM